MVSDEAGTPSNAEDLARGDHVFLAGHQSPAVRQVNESEFRTASEGIASNQEAVLRALAERRRLVFITGMPGAGKSHLVRWLHLNRDRVPRHDLEDVMTHVPRAMTNLADVLRVILRYADEDDRVEIEQALEAASRGSLSVTDARRRLLSALADQVEEAAPGIVRGEHDRFKFIVHEEVVQVLPGFLRSDAVRELLAREGGPADRVVKARLSGSRQEAGVADEQLRFRESDFDGAAEIPDKELNSKSMACRDALSGPDARFIEAASEILTEALDGALRQLMGLESRQLQDAVNRLIATLHQNGQRLVLYFEDWGLIAGFQHELVEAFASAPEGAVLAVIAITTQRLRELPGNILQRSTIFTLDHVHAHDPVEDAVDLLARNLNGIRIGREELRRQFRADQPVENWLPVACDECPFDARDECFSAFGSREVEGIGEIGMFPFTRGLVRNALARKLDSDRGYVPRTVLTDVLRIVLSPEHAEALSDGRFPTSEFAEQFRPADRRLGVAQREQVQQALRRTGSEASTDRWVAFLETYRPEMALTSLPATVSAALNLPVIEELEPGHSGVDTSADDSPPPGRSPGDRAPSSDSGLASVETPVLALEAIAWEEGRAVSQERNLRELVVSEARSAIHFELGLENEAAWDTPDGFDANHVGLGRPSGSRRGPQLLLEAATDGTAVSTLAYIHSRRGAWQELDALPQRRAATDIAVDRWARSLEDQLWGRDGELRRLHVVSLLRLLAVTGVAAGIATEIDETNILLVAVALDPPVTTELQKVALGSGLSSRSEARSSLLRRASFAQGPGDPNALDYAFLEPLLAEAVAALDLPDPEHLPEHLRDWCGELKGDLVAKLDQERTVLETWWSLNGIHTPHLDRLPELVSAEAELLNLAKDGRGILRASDTPVWSSLEQQRRRVDELLESIDPQSLGRLQGIGEDLARWNDEDLVGRLRIAVAQHDNARTRVLIGAYLMKVHEVAGLVQAGLGADEGPGSSEDLSALQRPLDLLEQAVKWVREEDRR